MDVPKAFLRTKGASGEGRLGTVSLPHILESGQIAALREGRDSQAFKRCLRPIKRNCKGLRAIASFDFKTSHPSRQQTSPRGEFVEKPLGVVLGPNCQQMQGNDLLMDQNPSKSFLKNRLLEQKPLCSLCALW